MTSNFLTNWLIKPTIKSTTTTSNSELTCENETTLTNSITTPQLDNITRHFDISASTSEAIIDKNEILNSNIFFDMHRNGRHFIRCQVCYPFQDLVKLFSKKTQIPNICQNRSMIQNRNKNRSFRTNLPPRMLKSF